jgi:hypothetical protein
MDAIKWQSLHDVPDEGVVSGDVWYDDFAQVSQPGNDAVQRSLFADDAANLQLCSRPHAYLGDSRGPLLPVWGRNDEIFGSDGARAFSRYATDAAIHQHLAPG